MIFALLVFALPIAVKSSFSVHYLSRDEGVQVVRAQQVVSVPASADHIADIYTRLSGSAPILREDSVHLPTLDIFSAKVQKPVILEIHGGSVPEGAQEIAQGVTSEGMSTGPAVESVVSVLKSHGIIAESKSISGSAYEVSEFINAHSGPVFILHHDIRRVLTSMNYYNETMGPNEQQISGYQIAAFVGIGMVVLLTSAVCMISGMEVIPDSLLYAKFQSTRANKND